MNLNWVNCEWFLEENRFRRVCKISRNQPCFLFFCSYIWFEERTENACWEFEETRRKKEFSSCLYTAIYERINIRYSELAQLLKDETSIIYVFTCDETKVICTYKWNMISQALWIKHNISLNLLNFVSTILNHRKELNRFRSKSVPGDLAYRYIMSWKFLQ